MKTPSEQRTNEVLADLVEEMFCRWIHSHDVHRRAYTVELARVKGKFHKVRDTHESDTTRCELLSELLGPILGECPYYMGPERTRMAVYDILRQLRDPNHRGTIKPPQISREGPFS